jgi:hypothetical protein
MMRVMRNHRYAAYNTPDAYEGLSVPLKELTRHIALKRC